MLALEWWALEIMALLSGLISVEAIGAAIIVENTYLTLFMVPVGL